MELPNQVGNVRREYRSYREALQREERAIYNSYVGALAITILVNEKKNSYIVILPETHAHVHMPEGDKDNCRIWAATRSVASAVLDIPGVCIAVEMPENVRGVLVSDVGLKDDTIARLNNGEDLFNLCPDAQASISHQIYAIQKNQPDQAARRLLGEIKGGIGGAKKRGRGDPSMARMINENMASYLNKNTKENQAIVFPVGADHQDTRYSVTTVADVLNQQYYDWEFDF